MLLKDRNVTATEHDEQPVSGRIPLVTDEILVRETVADKVERVVETARGTNVDNDGAEDLKPRR